MGTALYFVLFPKQYSLEGLLLPQIQHTKEWGLQHFQMYWYTRIFKPAYQRKSYLEQFILQWYGGRLELLQELLL